MRWYYYHQPTHTVIFGHKPLDDPEGYVFLGQTTNPKPKMAIAAFINQHDDIEEGVSIRQFDQEDV